MPLRAEACHCGMTRARAEELQAAAPPAAEAAAATTRAARAADVRREAIAAMTTDVKLLLALGALALVAGFGWLLFGPRRPSTIPAVLGWVDKGPPAPARPSPPPKPPFRLPWWK